MARKRDAEIIRHSVLKTTMEECTSLHRERRQPSLDSRMSGGQLGPGRASRQKEQ